MRECGLDVVESHLESAEIERRIGGMLDELDVEDAQGGQVLEHLFKKQSSSRRKANPQGMQMHWMCRWARIEDPEFPDYPVIISLISCFIDNESWIEVRKIQCLYIGQHEPHQKLEARSRAIRLPVMFGELARRTHMFQRVHPVRTMPTLSRFFEEESNPAVPERGHVPSE